MKKIRDFVNMCKSKKFSLSVTGFEPAISRFVAERVIRCATRIRYEASDVLKYLNNNISKS